MKARRKFLKQTFYLSTFLGLPFFRGRDAVSSPLSDSPATDAKAEKARQALLSMQRYSWEQGVASHAFIDRGDKDMAILFAKEAVLRQISDGRLGMSGDRIAVTDPAANGEAVLKAAEWTNSEELQKAASQMRDYLLNKAPKTKDGTLHHRTDVAQVWIDSMYMAPPFLASVGEPQEAVKQIKGLRNLLYNSTDQLYSHKWDESKNKIVREAYWGGGNGWVVSGITRTLTFFPKEMRKEKEELKGHLKEVILGCIAHQREDGLFHDVVDDPGTFVETNLAQMLAYSIYTGIRHNWLPKSLKQNADRMRAGANNKVDKFGYVTGACGAPRFNSPGRSTEAQAFYLLMENAAQKL